MSPLQLKRRGIGFAGHHIYGEGHPFTLIAQGRNGALPVFDVADRLEAETPAYGDLELIRTVTRLNPELPEIDPETVFVVTGQQPGLLLGPLYVFLKAISALSIAERLSSRMEKPVVPLFWMASEDHDVLEVNRVTVKERLFVNEYDGSLKRGMVPQVGGISMREAKEPLLDFLEETLPRTEFTDWVMDNVSSCDYTDYASAFSSLFRKVFSGQPLRIIDPVMLRPWTGKALADLVEKWPDVDKAFIAGTRKLERNGVKPVLGRPVFFEIDDGRRVLVSAEDDGMVLCTGKMTCDEAAAEIRRRPQEFSPGAALRPVLQDAVLPVVCTIGGPAEISYLWQVQEIYGVIGVRPSKPFPRISATFVEKRISGAAEKAGIDIDQFLRDPDADSQSSPAAVGDPLLDKWREEAGEFLSATDRIIGNRGDKGMQKARESLEAQISKLSRRIERGILEERGLGAKRLDKIRTALFPQGKPQERLSSLMEFLNLYGPDFIRQSAALLDPLLLEHQLVFMETVS